MSGRWSLRERVGALLSAIGVAILLASVVHYFIDGHVPNWVVLMIGSTIGFVGFYLLDPRGAVAVEGTVTGAAVQLLTVIRTGRRKSDSLTTVLSPAAGPVTVAPAPLAAVAPPSITVQHDPGA